MNAEGISVLSELFVEIALIVLFFEVLDAMIKVFHLFGEGEVLNLFGSGGLMNCGMEFVDLVDVEKWHGVKIELRLSCSG